MTRQLPPVFLDRDGVINRNREDYVRSIADWEPIPGALEAIARLSRAGHPVIVVTNQSAVSRGYCSLTDVEEVHALMKARVEEAGGLLTTVCYCPHHPDELCMCRKPETGMIDRARTEHGLPPGGYLVGDAASDMEMGRRAGLFTILVLTGRGADQLRHMSIDGTGMPWRVAADLSEASDIILASD
jgi:D-glycero-D-manno-heptose 1,7-bisphosphate phosphatase